MKSTVLIFCLSFLFISPLSAQHAPWEKTAGPPGLTVHVIYKTNNIVYAGTETQGVYKSTDNGLNWIAANGGIELTAVNDMTMSAGFGNRPRRNTREAEEHVTAEKSAIWLFLLGVDSSLTTVPSQLPRPDVPLGSDTPTAQHWNVGLHVTPWSSLK